MPIKIELTADTPEALQALLAGLTNHLRPLTVTPVRDMEDLKRVAGSVPNSPKRQTVTIDAPPAVDEAPVPEDADIEPTAVELAADEDDTNKKKAGRPKGAKNKPKDPDPGPVSAPNAGTDKALSPSDALNRAIEILTQLYTRGPTGQDGVRKLQQKYGVKSFVQMPPDKAHDLLADARALVDVIDAPKAGANTNDPVDF